MAETADVGDSERIVTLAGAKGEEIGSFKKDHDEDKAWYLKEGGQDPNREDSVFGGADEDVGIGDAYWVYGRHLCFDVRGDCGCGERGVPLGLS